MTQSYEKSAISEFSDMMPIEIEKKGLKIFGEKTDCDAFLITSQVSRRYLTGFDCSDGAILICKEDAYFLTDFRYYEAAMMSIDRCRVVEYSSLFSELDIIFKRHNIKSVMIEQSSTSLFNWEMYIKQFPNIKFISSDILDNLLIEKRKIKSDIEIQKMTKAQEITEKAYLEILNFIKPGVTEREIAIELEMRMRKLGAERVAFDLITISGKNTSLPHGVPTDKQVMAGDFVTMDIGAVYEGLHSDMTRTVGVSHLSDKQIEIYNIVKKAQQAGLDAVKAGVKCSDIDKVARDIIDNAGYGKYFGHSLGHSVGYEIHESPRFSPNCNEITRENIVMTVEPGIYLSGEFGVRIEDMVLVKENGYHNFTNITKELVIL